MTQHSNIKSAVSALAIACLTAPLFSVAAQAQEPKMGGTLIYANNSGPGALDPQMAASLVELEVIVHIFEPLVALGENYSAVPVLAKNWEIGDGGRTFTFNLREGVKFHNGELMTSADVKATFERYAEISPNKDLLADVASYETPDDLTFVVKLNEPNAVFIDQMKSPSYPLSIMQANQRDKPPREVDVIGTGPFKLTEWVKDSHLILEKNEDYQANTNFDGPDGYGGNKTVYVDRIRSNFLVETNSRIAAMQTGEAHFATSLTLDTVKRLEGMDSVKPITIFPYCQQYLILHSQQAPTDNVKIRQAIRQAINVDELVAVTGEKPRLDFSMVYPGGEYFTPENDQWYDQRDPEGAKALLEEAGYNGEEILLQSNTNYSYMRDSVLVVAEQLKDVGINVKMDVTDWTTNASNLQTGEGGWNLSTTSFCSPPILGPQQWQTFIYNFPHIEGNQVLDDAYAKFYTSLELEDRKAAWKDIEATVLGDAYMIKVSNRGSERAYSEKLHGYTPFPMNRFWNVWVD